MPKRTDLKSILIIGAGPIIIGQACEFDYSGAQACKALKAMFLQVFIYFIHFLYAKSMPKIENIVCFI